MASSFVEIAKAGSTAGAKPLKIRSEIAALEKEINDNRRWFHAHPELSMQEFETSKKVADLLTSYGITEVTTGVGKTGVVAMIRGEAGTGPCIALRADMDALPLPETATVEYKSKNEGVMHACGHDGHMSSLLAAAKVLFASKSKLKGTVKLVFQPAEEGFAGAREMIKDGVLTEKVGGVAVDFIYGIHLWSYLPLGIVSVKEGPTMAASDRFTLHVHGSGGHGAHPQGTVDAIISAAHLTLALQTIVSRNRDPLDPAVLSVCKFHSGTGYNIIADKAELCGTVRTFNPETKELIITRMKEVCNGVAATFGGKIEVEYDHGYPATVNSSPEAVAVVKAAGDAIVGEDRCGHPTMTCGAEDFSYFLNEKPGAFFFVGCALPGETRPHHKSVFDFDETALMVSASCFLGIVEHYLLA
jgi:amidohydrolase